MKQEPVAWMYAVNGIWTSFSDEIPPDDAYDEGTLIPLYTEPQYRELSDEDRLSFTKAYFNIHPEAHLSEQFKIKLYELNEFARSILKKVSEK